MLARYEPALVAGWVAEEPSLSREECLKMARAEAVERMKQRVDRFMPGDSHRMQHLETRLSAESLEVCLVPVWVLAARYDPEKPPLRVVVNGQSGEVHGEVPISWVKVALTVVGVGVLGLLAYLLWGQGGRS